MKLKVLSIAVCLLLLSACGAGGPSSKAVPTIVLDSGTAVTPAATAQITSHTGGGVSASGFVVADQVAELAFRIAGNVKAVKAAPGDQVKAGQVLVQLDDTVQQIQLAQALQALTDLTSASALAAAQQTVAQDQQDLYNQQVALNNLLTQHNNEGLISNAQASLVLAENAMKDAQTAYDNTPGDKTRDPAKALAYQRLYTAQQNYNNVLYTYNIYTGKSNQAQVDEATAKVALAKARLADDQALVTALTGGQAPQSASGTGYSALVQARLALQTAQANEAATGLIAPFDGTLASVSVVPGDFVSPGQAVVVLSDVGHLHVETTDLSERDVPALKIGGTASVNVKALNQDVPAKVTFISPLASTLGGDVVYKVTLELDSIPAGLLAGMSVDVSFDANK